MKKDRAVIPALAARETIKEVDTAGLVVKTHDRAALWLVQTPQAFRYDDILDAHRRGNLARYDFVKGLLLLHDNELAPALGSPGVRQYAKKYFQLSDSAVDEALLLDLHDLFPPDAGTAGSGADALAALLEGRPVVEQFDARIRPDSIKPL